MGKFFANILKLTAFFLVLEFILFLNKRDINAIEGLESLWNSFTGGSSSSGTENGGSESGGGSESVDESSVAGYNKEVYTYSLLATKIREIYVLSNFPDDVKKLFDSFEQYVVAVDNRDANSLNAAHDVMCDDAIKNATLNFLANKAKKATGNDNLGEFTGDYNRVNDYTIEFKFNNGTVKVFLPFGFAADGIKSICKFGVMSGIYSGEWELVGERPDDNSYFLMDVRSAYDIIQDKVEKHIYTTFGKDENQCKNCYIKLLPETTDCYAVYEYGPDEVKPIEPGSEIDIVYKATRVMNDALNKQADPHTLDEAVEKVYNYVTYTIEQNPYEIMLKKIKKDIDKNTNYSMGEQSEDYQLACTMQHLMSLLDGDSLDIDIPTNDLPAIDIPARDIHLAVEGNKAKINRVKLNGGNAYYPFGINTEYGVANGTSYYGLDKYAKEIKPYTYTYTYKHI